MAICWDFCFVIFQFDLYSLRNWFKGDDTRTLCSYLAEKFNQLLVAHPWAHDHIAYLASIHKALVASNLFLGTLYRAGLWLTNTQRKRIIDALEDLLKSFDSCASYAYHLGWVRFKYQPKFHLIAEMRFSLMTDAVTGCSSLNPLCWSCQMDEDFIGRISTQSRKVSSRTLHLKVCQRYKISLAAAW